MTFGNQVVLEGPYSGFRYDLSTYEGAAQFTLDAFEDACQVADEHCYEDIFEMSAEDMLRSFCPDFVFDDDDFGLDPDDLLPFIDAEMRKMRDRLTGRGGQGIELKDYAGQDVDELLLEKALDFFISLEPDPESETGMEDLEAALAAHEDEVAKAKAILRKYGEQIRPSTLERMQEVYYRITGSGKYGSDVLRCSVAGSVLSSAWHGVGGWQK